MTPTAALRAATSSAAELLCWQDRIGTIEEGKLADLIAVEGDPTQDISCLRNVKAVMLGGELIRDDC